MPRKTQRETTAQRKSKGLYTRAELAKSRKAKTPPKNSGSKRPSTAKADPSKSVLNDPMYSPSTTTKAPKKSSGGGTKRAAVKKATGTTKGVVKAKSSVVKSSAKGPKKVVVSKTKKQERQQKRTQRKAKRAADARNKANTILKKTSGTGKKVTSKDQRKLKRLRGKYSRNTK
jgi:hypothetical protein